jgi:hypothetical protein
MAGDFDWRYAREGEERSVFSAMSETLAAGIVAGISVWTDEGPEANLLVFPGLEGVTFELDLNRRLLEGSEIFAGIGRYLQRMVAPLQGFGLSGVTASDAP